MRDLESSQRPEDGFRGDELGAGNSRDPPSACRSERAEKRHQRIPLRSGQVEHPISRLLRFSPVP